MESVADLVDASLTTEWEVRLGRRSQAFLSTLDLAYSVDLRRPVVDLYALALLSAINFQSLRPWAAGLLKNLLGTSRL